MRRAAGICVLVLMLAVPVIAQSVQSSKVSLSANNMEIGKVFATLSKQAQVQILGDPTVKCTVSCSLTDVTVEQALTIICKMNKLVWIKVYAAPSKEGAIRPSEIFKLYDALMALKGSALIYEDPTTETQTAFVPGIKTGSLDPAPFAQDLRLRPAYLVRVEPQVTEAKAAKAKTKQELLQQQQQQDAQQQNGGMAQAPPADSRAAADQVWNYFNQMSPDQRREVMGQIRQKMVENMSPEQQQRVQDWMKRRQQNRDQQGQQ